MLNNEIGGVININKPAGWTSQDVCAKLRKRLGTRRVGHAGTLDPMATGVLPVAFGKATRMMEYYDGDIKVYRAEMQLGITTDTLDITGTVTGEYSFDGVTEESVISAMSKMKGVITQVPPKYSAIKVGGKRLYEYAREGKEVEIKPREIYIIGISDIEADLTTGKVGFTVACSKGTYIRSICDDIGRELGCGACMSDLIRVSTGCFSLQDSVEIDDLFNMTDEELSRVIIPVEETMLNIGKVQLLISEKGYLNGMMIGPQEALVTQESHIPEWVWDRENLMRKYRLYNSEGKFLGTVERDEITGSFKPDKVLVTG